MAQPNFLKLALALLCTTSLSPLWADDYSTSWTLTMGCPVHGDTTSSGALSVVSGAFSASGTCSRESNGFSKYDFTSVSGGTLHASTRYGLYMRKLSEIPPVRNTDTAPLFSVSAECPTNTQVMNWIFMQSDPSRVDDYFWGTSTMTPTSVTMTKFYGVDGTQNFSGNYSLPVGTCSSGVFDVSGSQDFQAKLYSTTDWSGFYKTAPGNVSFVGRPWTVERSYFVNKTYVGLYYTSQSAANYRPIQVTAAGLGGGELEFTVKPLSNAPTSTIDTSWTDTIVLSSYNSPSAGFMRGTISRSGETGSQNIGCLAHDAGAGGYTIACSARSPRTGQSSSESYHIIFNHKGDSGMLDPAFNVTGYNKTGFTSGWREKANAAAMQSDGKIVLVGMTTDYNAYTYFAAARYNSDGTLDTTFGTSGKVARQFNIPYDDGFGMQNWDSVYQIGNAVKILSDGKILVAGSIQDYYGTEKAFVARLTSSGGLDPTFGDSGLVIYPAVDMVAATALAVQSDNAIVVTGLHNLPARRWSIARLTSSGSSDGTFNGGSVYKLSMGQDSVARDVTVATNGKIIVVGSAVQADYSTRDGVAVFTSSGALDTSFNSTGTVLTTGGSQPWSVAVQSDGKYVVAGTPLTLSRYNTDGTLDTTFSGDGKVSGIYGRSVAILDDGKIMVCGGDGNGISTSRYNTDGTADWTYGTGATGTLTTSVPADAEDIGMGNYTVATCAAMMVQTDGKIVIAGDVYAQGLEFDQVFMIARIIP